MGLTGAKPRHELRHSDRYLNGSAAALPPGEFCWRLDRFNVFATNNGKVDVRIKEVAHPTFPRRRISGKASQGRLAHLPRV